MRDIDGSDAYNIFLNYLPGGGVIDSSLIRPSSIGNLAVEILTGNTKT